MSNSLLYSISSIGSMSMDQYYSYFDTLYGQNAESCDDIDLRGTRNRVIRALDSLGYCEFDFGRRFVNVCDSAIISLPHSGIPRAIYTGARTMGMLRKISTYQKSHRNEVSIRSIPQFLNSSIRSDSEELFRLPDTILIEAASRSMLDDLTAQAGIKTVLSYSPAPVIADFSSDIDEFKESLSKEITVLPDLPVKIFDTEKLRFVNGPSKNGTSSISAYKRPRDQQYLHIYSDAVRNVKIDRDWGRYLVLKDNKVRVLLYDARRQALAVPSSVPMPRLLSRAAAMCSGKAPVSSPFKGKCNCNIPTNHSIDIYQTVPLQIATIIAKKIGQDLVDWNANDYFEG